MEGIILIMDGSLSIEHLDLESTSDILITVITQLSPHAMESISAADGFETYPEINLIYCKQL